MRCRYSLPVLLLALPVASQEPVDEPAVEILRKHGLEHSLVMEHLSWMCDVHGPRLTGSPNLKNAQDWAMKTFEEWGLKNVHKEAWGPFGRGWRLERFTAQVVGANSWPVVAYPKAWSSSIEGGRVEAEVVAVGEITAQELDAMDLTGKIVLVESPREVDEPFEGEAQRFDAERLLHLTNGTRPERQRPPRRDFRRGFARRGQVFEKVWNKEPLAIVDRSYKGDYGTVFATGARVAAPEGTPRGEGPSARDAGVEVIPQITMAVEHYNRICRLLDKGVKVRMALELEASYFENDPMQYNVLAEIPGTDPELGEQLVMLGAHFDSWHTGTGATDNGCGSAVMMEAMRLLTKLMEETGKEPRRTIRVALWSGEEQGLLGSRAYVREHFAEGGRREPVVVKPGHALLSGYYNLDNGTGRIRGVFLQGNTAVAPIFRAWLEPFHDLGAATLTPDDTGGTDHLAFDRVGLPGFQFIQDPVAYSTRTHHSSMDNWDHAVAEDLQQAATIIASFVWHTAQRDEMLPRELPETPAEAGFTEAGGRRR